MRTIHRVDELAKAHTSLLKMQGTILSQTVKSPLNKQWFGFLPQEAF